MALDTMDIKLASCFAQPTEAEAWVSAIIKRVGPWVKKQGNKSLWDVVLFASQLRGVLKQPLSREKFATLLVRLCHDALETSDTPKSLRASMEKSPYTKRNKQNYDRLPDAHALRALVKEIDSLLDGEEIVTIPKEHTLESRLREFLKAIVDEQTEKMPCSVVCEHPVYGNDVMPTFSIETYSSKKFKESHQPSYVNAYECVDDVVDTDKIYTLDGKYNRMPGVKLWVVSTHGYRSEVYNLAQDRCIGLILVDLKKEIDETSIVLPRSIEDFVRKQQYIDTMMGRRLMEFPILLWRDYKVTSSMVEMLSADGVRIKQGLQLQAPRYSNDEIEELANYLTSGLPPDDLTPVNLEHIVSSQGLTWQWGNLPSEQLGLLTLDKGQAIINDCLRENKNRQRFTLAHELGHYLLHYELFKGKTFPFFKETSGTLSSFTPLSGENMNNLEHHANHFAACLLLPRNKVVSLYKEYFGRYMTDVFGDQLQPLYWDENNRVAMQNCKRVLGPMSQRFEVSVEALRWRLKNLGWLTVGKSNLPPRTRKRYIDWDF